MAVIGFFSYSDFLDEIKQTALFGQPVRVQAYYKLKGDKTGLLQKYTFITEVAVQVTGLSDTSDVLVCRFITGETSVMNADNDQSWLGRLDQRNRRVAGLVRQRLQAAGYHTRTGVFANAKHSEIESDPGDLIAAAAEEANHA